MDERDIDRLEELELLLASIVKEERRRQGRCLCLDKESAEHCVHFNRRDGKCFSA